MEWRTCVDRFSQSVKSVYSNAGGTPMAENEKMKATSGKDGQWIPYKNLIGKLITSTNTGFTQTKGGFVEAGRQCSFMRLNSQGESVSLEEDLANFPVIEPKKEMAQHYQPQKPSQSGKGWFNPGQNHFHQHLKHNHARHQGPPPYIPGYMNLTNSANPFANNGPTLGHHMTQNPWHPQQMWNNLQPFSWVPHIPQCVFNPTCNPRNQSGPMNNTYHFQGNCHSGYRDPKMDKRNFNHPHHKHYRGKSPRPTSNRTNSKDHSRSRSRERTTSPQPVVPCDVNEPAKQASDVIDKLSNLTISSENSSGNICSPLQSQKDGSVPESHDGVKELVCQKESSASLGDSLPSTSVAVEADVDLFGGFSEQPSVSNKCQSTERIDDRFLAIELCSSPKSSSPINKVKISSSHSSKKDEKAIDVHVKNFAPDSIAQVHTSCVTLTPKTPSIPGSSKKKKSRPSSKKRRRQKLQRSAEGQIFQLRSRCNKKQKMDDSATSNPAMKSRSDSMSFVIDFSESEMSETENLCGSSPVCTSSSPLAKFSFIISAADLSDDDDDDDEDSSDQETSDSDFYEDQPDCAEMPETPHNKNGKRSHLLQELENMSPFTFQIHCKFSNPTPMQCESSESSEAEESPKIEETEEKTSDVITEANARWLDAYGINSLPKKDDDIKVHFATDAQLETVHTLQPEEVEAYREARLGKWEEYARDSERFRNRIEEVSRAIDHCLQPAHRARVVERLQSL